MSFASQLTQRVTIQKPTWSDDGYGGKTVSWSDLANVYANVTPIFLTNRERDISGQIEANASYRVDVRARTDVTAAMRIVWKTHTLLIHSIHEQGERLSILTYEENL